MKSRQVVFDIHRLKDEGYSTRSIARHLGIGRNTVVRYLKKPDQSFTARKRPSKLDPFKPAISEMLEKDPAVNGIVIFQKLTELGYTGKTTILREYLCEQRGQVKQKTPYIRFETPPGEQMQIDWGHFDAIQYGDTKRKLYAFVAVLSWSRMLYVEFTHSQNQATLHNCLTNAFNTFGGTPKQIVVDNMLTAVTDRQSRLIRFNDSFLDFLRPLRIIPRACNPRSPYEKGKVESAVKYVRRNFMPLRHFKGLNDCNSQVKSWLRVTANTRVHETTGKVPVEHLKAEGLKPLTITLDPCFETTITKVQKDFSVTFDTNRYTCPPWAISKEVTIKADQAQLIIYHKEKKICSYPRCWQRKKRMVTASHIEQVKKLQRKNWETKEIACFASLGEEFRDYLEKLPGTGQPLKKQVVSLLHLKDQYGTKSLSWAILKALKHKAYGADYIENILYQEMIPINQHPPVKLQNEALNRIRLSEPNLTDYDAIALKRRRK